MSLEEYKITDADIRQKGVVAAPDKLTGSAEDNKRVFDRLIEEVVKVKMNGGLDAMAAAQASAAASQATAAESAAAAGHAEQKSRSWAVGGTGSREGEDTDNASFYAGRAAASAGEAASSAAAAVSNSGAAAESAAEAAASAEAAAGSLSIVQTHEANTLAAKATAEAAAARTEAVYDYVKNGMVGDVQRVLTALLNGDPNTKDPSLDPGGGSN